MSNLVCLRHPRYDGKSTPELSCKTCCAKFVDRVRTEQAKKFEPLTRPEQAPSAEFKPMTAGNFDSILV